MSEQESPVKSIFARNLRFLREKQHLSQYDLARELEIPRDRIKAWELDRGHPKGQDMDKLVRLFNVAEDHFDNLELDQHDTLYYGWVGAVSKFDIDPLPSIITWRKLEAMITVLEAVKAPPNYLFLPEGGGIHLYGAIHTSEPGCIGLKTSDDTDEYAYVVKAEKLHFIRPGKDLAWSYFIIEADKLEPFLPSSVKVEQEHLLIDSSGNYFDPYGVTKEVDMAYKHIIRRLVPGLYLFVNNFSLYNELDNHLGRHDRWGLEGIIKHMELLYSAFEKKAGNTNYYSFRSDHIALDSKG